MRPVFVSSHPIVHHKLASLRDVRTGPPEFRHLVRTLAVLIAAEATADLPTRDEQVTTPLGLAASRVLTDVVGIVPVLRAGLGMAEGILELIPEAEVWHIGLFRDETTLRPTEYYNKFPARPRITASGLPISCAMPADRTPTVIIFSARTSWFSRLRSSD